jgi:hypothetical protein
VRGKRYFPLSSYDLDISQERLLENTMDLCLAELMQDKERKPLSY